MPKLSGRLGALAIAAACLVTAPPIASAQQRAVIGRSFAGSPSFGFDSDGAVGPDHFAEITNLGLRVTALANGAVVYSASLSQFFGGKAGAGGTGCCFDPHIEFDHGSGRWFAVALSNAYSTLSAVHLGVSDTADPSGGWKGVIIDADLTNLRWADYPYLGFDGSAVYIVSNMFGVDAATPTGRQMLVVPKVDLVGAVPTSARLARFFLEFGSQVPPNGLLPAVPQVDYLGTSSDGLTTSAAQAGQTLTASGYRWFFARPYQKMTGQSSGAATLLPWATSPGFEFDSSIQVPPQTYPTDYGRQPGTTMRLGVNIGNNNVRVGDFLYSVYISAVRGRAGIVWSRFQVSTGRFVEAGFIGDEVNDYIDPSIAANSNGDVVIAYVRTGPSEFGSLYVSAGRPSPASGKVVFGAPMLLKAGSNIYDENGPRYGTTGPARFSDYSSAVSVHPTDPSRFWVTGSYISARNVASTWMAEIIMTPAPLVTTLRGKEILWRHTNGSTAKWVMNGLAVSGSTLLFGPGSGWGINRVGEFNADAANDIFWESGHGAPAVWLMNGLTFTGGATLLGAGTGWLVNCLADFNGDGRSDIVWQYLDGTTAIWLMNGSTRVAGAILQGANTGWSIQHTGDFDGNGKADLLWQHTDGSIGLWLMDGLTSTAGVILSPAGAGWSIKGVGDFNGDGRSDILWQHLDGSTGLWLMNGTTAPSAAVLLPAGTGWTVKGIGTFDANATSDIVWQHTSGSTALWLMNGLGYTLSNLLSAAGTGWSVRQIADYNADGKADLLWQHADGSSALWIMNGASLSSGIVLLGAGTGWQVVP